VTTAHAAIGSGDDPVPSGDPSAAHRLPYTVRPIRYDLALDPDLARATFSGSVRITAEALEPVDRIVMHAAELDITSAMVAGGSDPARPAQVTLDAATERLTLGLAESIPTGEVTIDLTFTGVLNDQLHGFYRSTFTDDSGTIHTIATTQFEATDARRAFPCFDEPDRKAVFAVTLDVDSGLLAVSNGPVIAETPLPGGRRRVQFGSTIAMSTYLVAFVIGPLVATEPVDVDGVAIRIVHVPGRTGLTGFAESCAEHALRFFADWFGLPYPADKLDLVAIPDFAFGAMENLGCVTFRETALLVDTDKSSQVEQQRVADVISHEIAHMWFGDLVTMKWWNGIWLNEAFATLMELLCVDHFRPQWRRWVSFASERDVAMATDALHSTRPVEYPVGPPEEAQGMFDVLTYQKGAGVLRMLEQYLGEERFRAGIRLYLQRHRLGNTETADLWDAIEAASGEPVRQVMDSWILQGGFPLLDVSAAGTQTQITQEPFYLSPAADNLGKPDGEPTSPRPSAIGRQWMVPVLTRRLAPTTGSASSSTAVPTGRPDGSTGAVPDDITATAAGSILRTLLGSEPARLDVPLAETVVNAGGAGFYRVRYPAAHLALLAGRWAQLTSVERFNLLGDTWAGILAGQIPLDQFLTLAEALADESDPDVWGQAAGVMRFLERVVPDDVLPTLGRYTSGLVGPVVERLGWERRAGEDDRMATLRSLAITLTGTVGGDGAVRQRCQSLHSAMVAGQGTIEPDLAAAVVSVVAAGGDRSTYELFLERYRHPGNPQEEMRYLYALADIADPDVAADVFALALGEVRSQNAPFLIQALLASRSHGPATWHRLVERWDEIVRRTPTNILPRMLDGAKWLCRDHTLAGDVRSFLATHPVRGGQRTVDQIVERLGVNERLAAALAPAAGASLQSAADRLGTR